MKKFISVGGLVMSMSIFVAGARFAMAEIPIQKSDAEILGVLSVIDQNEIQATQLAEQKNIDHNVLDFAQMSNSDHNKHLDQTRQLSQELGMTTVNNGILEQLRKKGKEDLAELAGLDGENFAQLFIADIIKAHSEALNWIDVQDSQNAQVKDFLKQTRRRLNDHFEKALQIQKKQKINQT